MKDRPLPKSPDPKLSHRRWLVGRGLSKDADRILTAARPKMAWRLSPDSPDALEFRMCAVEMMAACRPLRVKKGGADALDLPFVPAPDASIATLANVPLAYEDLGERLMHLLYDLEEGAILHTVRQELLLHATGSIPADARDEAFQHLWLWIMEVLKEEVAVHRGRWLAPILHTPIQRLVHTHGDRTSANGWVPAMRAVDAIVQDLTSIGGERRIKIFNRDGGMSSFLITPDGRYIGDDPNAPWADTALRGILADAMTDAASLLVDRMGTMRIEGQPARETFAASLGPEGVEWLDAAACREVYSYDFTTGKALPHEPGRVFRSGPRSDANA